MIKSALISINIVYMKNRTNKHHIHTRNIRYFIRRKPRNWFVIQECKITLFNVLITLFTKQN